MACRVDADCGSGQICASNVCVQGPPTGCGAAGVQCAAGTTCQNGVCVGTTVPACRVDSDCAAGQSCQGGVCGTSIPPGCTANTQCPTGSICSAGQCISTAPGCTSDADCFGGSCQRGVCIGTGPSGGSCSAQGSGTVTGTTNAVAVCSALGNGSISLTNGVAFIGQDPNSASGGNGLLVVDQTTGSGVDLPLNACPAAAGTVSVSGAQVMTVTPNAAPGLTLYAARDASGTITFTTVGHYTGTFSLTLTGGGTVSGTFDMQ